MEYKKISITGDLGSGKSTVARLISKIVGCEYYSTGDIQREIANKIGISTLELNKQMEENAEIDNEIDEFNKNLNFIEKSFIIDSRMAWFFIPKSFKVYLQVNPDVSARRVLNDNKRKSESYNDIQKAKKDLINRKQSENERFRRLYNVNCTEMNNYDLVVDTSYSDPELIAGKIIEQQKIWLKNIEIFKYWVSPKLLIPTQAISRLGRSNAKKIYKSIQSTEFNPEFPIKALNSDGFFFIMDGHLRVSAAILQNLNFIPIELISDNDLIFGIPVSEFLKSELKISYIYDWEECHKFSYLSYPEIFSNIT